MRIRRTLIIALAGFAVAGTIFAKQEAMTHEQLVASLDGVQGEPLANLKRLIIAEGMPIHDALYTGPAATAELRAKLRAELRAARDATALDKGLVVHEWGSVMVLANHDGATVGYLGDDKSDLPPFVHTIEQHMQDQPMVIRKPILYFYTKQNNQLLGQVAIHARHGLITQWYPKATSVQPRYHGQLPDHLPVANGNIHWSGVRLFTDGSQDASLPAVDADHPWWHIARDVDAATVTVNGESEKFLFYRGVNRFGSKVTVKGSESDGRYALHNTGKHTIRNAVMMRVNEGRAVYQLVPALEPGQKVTVSLADASDWTADTSLARFTEQLEADGLFPKEADVVRRIWGKFFFKREGVRLLYVMPEPRADELLRFSIHPRPADVARTLIVQVECATERMTHRIAELIAQLGDQDYKVRERAQRQLERLDRFAEALLRKAVAESHDVEVRERAEAILKKLEAKKAPIK